MARRFRTAPLIACMRDHWMIIRMPAMHDSWGAAAVRAARLVREKSAET